MAVKSKIETVTIEELADGPDFGSGGGCAFAA
jgi:hypothetical protein